MSSPRKWIARVGVLALLCGLVQAHDTSTASAATAGDLDKIALSDTPTAVSAHATIAADGDHVVAAWVDQGLSPTGYDDLVARQSHDGGVTWETRQNLTLASGPLHGAKH